MRANMELEETQKSSPESLESLENDIPMRNVDSHETMETPMEIVDFSAPEGQL